MYSCAVSPKLVSVPTEQLLGENVLQAESKEHRINLVSYTRVCAVTVPQLPVHNVSGERCGEAEHVEADLRGGAERQAGHDGEEGQIHPQACERQRRGKEFSNNNSAPVSD